MTRAEAAASSRRMRAIAARPCCIEPRSPAVIVARWTRQPARASRISVPAHVISMSSGWAITASTLGIGYFSSASLTGRPRAADRSAAKTTRWLSSAVSKSVSGIFFPDRVASVKAWNCGW